VTRRRVAAALLVVLAAGLSLALLLRNNGEGEVPTFVVTSADLERRVTAEGFLEAEKSTPISVPTEAQSGVKIGWLADDQSAVKQGDVVVMFDPTEFEETLRRGTDSATRSDNRIEKSTTGAAAVSRGLERDALFAQLELETARRFSRRDEDVFSRFERIESELDEALALERKEYADQVRGIRNDVARAERELLEIERRQAELKISQARSGLSALKVEAPHDGIIVLKRDWRGDVPTVGSTFWPGRPIAEIPALDSMKAEVFVLEADAAGIAAGQKARVVVESASQRSFAATVTRIDKVAKPRQRGVPVQYFGVTLKLDEHDGGVMKPGARVRASIELDSQKSSITIPRQAVFDRKGEKIAWVRRGEEFVAVPVSITGATTGRFIIGGGLEPGDVVALTDPERERNGGGSS
jgi:HlyD family secretion protein